MPDPLFAKNPGGPFDLMGRAGNYGLFRGILVGDYKIEPACFKETKDILDCSLCGQHAAVSVSISGHECAAQNRQAVKYCRLVTAGYTKGHEFAEAVSGNCIRSHAKVLQYPEKP